MNRSMPAAVTSHCAAGFTLLELIVVMLVFAVLAVMAYGGLGSVLKTRKAVEESLGRTAQYQKVFVRMRNDFQNLRNRTIRDEFGETQAALIGTPQRGVEFTRGGWRNPLYLPRSSLERVAYLVEDKKLQRASWRVLDRAPDSKPVTLDLLDGVEEIRWRYLNDQNEWREAWPPGSEASGAPPTGAAATQAGLPKAIEMTLQTKDWGELRFLYMIAAGSSKNLNTPPPVITP